MMRQWGGGGSLSRVDEHQTDTHTHDRCYRSACCGALYKLLVLLAAQCSLLEARPSFATSHWTGQVMGRELCSCCR